MCFWKYFNRVFRPDNKEHKALEYWFEYNDVDAFISFINNHTTFFERVKPGLWRSNSRRMVVRSDIYGFEIKIDNKELCDCLPDYYGRNFKKGQDLYDSIVANLFRRSWYGLDPKRG